MEVYKGTDTLFVFKFDHLPTNSFFEGLDDIYFLDELTLLNGMVIKSETQDLRQFLYSVEVDINENEIYDLQIVARDFSENTTSMEITIP